MTSHCFSGKPIAPLLLVLIAATAVQCTKQKEKNAPTERPTSGMTDKAQPDAKKLQASQDATGGRIDALITKMQHRKHCNRVMGCKSATSLFQYGKAATVPIINALEKHPKSDGFWAMKLIDLLGQLNDKRALPLLKRLLVDGRLEPRCRAAIGLARMKDPSTLPAINRALESPVALSDPAFRTALMLAQDRLNQPSPARRTQAASVFTPSLEALGGLNALYLMLFAEVAGEWPLPEAAKTLRLIARHRSVFARRAAIRAIMRIRDHGSIPTLIARLDDTMPSVRKAAMAALRVITGRTNLTTPDTWKQWCKMTQCRPNTPKIEPVAPQKKKTSKVPSK
jgi:HEAT repeat protein